VRLWYTVAAITILALGCTNPFSGRDSEAPTENTGTFLTPIDPKFVLVNLEASYNEKIITNYASCLDTTLFFSYDFLIIGADLDSGWSYDTDIQLTENLFNIFRFEQSSMSMNLELKPILNLPDNVEDTAAVLYREYALTTIIESSTGRDTVIYRGTSEFHVLQSSTNLWSIVRWRDQHASTEDTAWCDFKNGYR